MQVCDISPMKTFVCVLQPSTCQTLTQLMTWTLWNTGTGLLQLWDETDLLKMNWGLDGPGGVLIESSESKLFMVCLHMQEQQDVPEKQAEMLEVCPVLTEAVMSGMLPWTYLYWWVKAVSYRLIQSGWKSSMWSPRLQWYNLYKL